MDSEGLSPCVETALTAKWFYLFCFRAFVRCFYLPFICARYNVFFTKPPDSKLMKLVYAVICLALVTASCQDSSQTTETTPLLKSDTSFVVGPELPQKDSQAVAPTTPTAKQQAPARKNQATVASSSNSQGNTPAATEESGNATQPAGEPAKKGWSKTAKGAVIGGVVGAGAGAVINKKNRAAGAVIGGVVGAGAGAVIGNEMDKKDGRH